MSTKRVSKKKSTGLASVMEAGETVVVAPVESPSSLEEPVLDVAATATATATATAATVATVATAAAAAEPLPAKPAPKKRSSKKTPPVVAIVTPHGITGSFLSEQRPLIAHIPVTAASITFDQSNLLQYSPVIPDVPAPYDNPETEELSYLEGIQTGAGVQSDVVQKAPAPKPVEQTTPCRLPTNYSEKLMVLFQDSNRYKKLPEKTDIACFWCCHSFATPPFAIPSHIKDDVWNMYGNFCSPECSAAYLFKERIDNHAQWERYALLNSLYTEDAEVPMGSPHGIRPAPPREVLRMFGGSMDIAEYRAVLHEKKLRIDVLTPPMVSIIQTMDTKPIDFYDQNANNVSIKGDLQHKYNAPGAQGLRLRRSKPVKSRESTVEWAMQIQHVGQN